MLSLIIMSHFQHNVSRFLIQLHFSYVMKVLHFFLLIQVIMLLIFAYFLGYSRRIGGEEFERSTRNKF